MPLTNPTEFDWTPPTTNKDGSAIPAGEITGYQVGIRKDSDAAGTYGVTKEFDDPAAVKEPLSAFDPVPSAVTDFRAA